METVNFKCGHCGNLMGVGAAYLGQQVRCPHCQQVVVAPAATPTPTDATLSQRPSPIPAGLEQTSLLPSSGSEVLLGGGPTSDLFDNPAAPPRMEIPSRDATLALDPQARAHDSSADATMAYLPPPDQAAAPPSTSQEIPDWLKPAAPTPSVDGVVSELPVPPPVQAPRGGMSMGMLLFVSLVFMPLVLYSILATVLAILFYSHSNNPSGPPDPREFLIDSEGDHPGTKKVKTGSRLLETDVKLATKPLPDHLRIKLGDTLAVGDLRIKADRVEHAVIQMRTPGFKKLDDIETYALHLHLTNLSKDVSYYPMDCCFDRKWNNKGRPPLTVLMAGETLKFFGGPAEWNLGQLSREHDPTPRNYVLGNNYEKPLNPGDEMDTFVCMDGNDPRLKDLLQYKGPFVWHVHLRRGLVHWNDHDYSAAAVVGVEFTDQDVKVVRPKSDPGQ